MVGEIFGSVAAVATANVALTEGLIKWFKIEKKWMKVTIAWVCPLILCIVGLLIQAGIVVTFGPITSWVAWVLTICTGVGVGLMSNGIADLEFVQKALGWIKDAVAKVTTKKENK